MSKQSIIQLDMSNTLLDININEEVIIYPTEKGWKKIKELMQIAYRLTNEQVDDWVFLRTTDDNGYTDQLWVIISILHPMFFNGQDYLEHTWMRISDFEME